MIRLDNVSKQIGHQILFIEASAAILRGEKVGLVGPNGAGKTTLFRMITGEEQPDEGQVAVDRGVTIGYFSQDVGEMSGRSAVSEVMDGAGPVSTVATELKELSVEELNRKVTEMRENLFNLKIRLKSGTLTSTADLGKNKKDLARVLTVLTQKQMATKAAAPAKKA